MGTVWIDTPPPSVRLHRADTFPCSGGHHSIDMIHRVLIRKTRMGGDDNSEDVDEGSRKGTKDCSVMAGWWKLKLKVGVAGELLCSSFYMTSSH
ncbi:Hypothetical protein NTJ_00453 [Nesidiocoris tenuis]|uniref:Uncharacterized protein n=1 Tax=Nesidiocoris tenuis TaxID=355587 RepID=A0ABN7A9T7_9HEMI|nr:Hypothetical protein NTJ_00453 [Nesidiocoris tenuis]